VWQNAHEWVRSHLRLILDVYASVPGEGIDIAPYFGGLPPECFEDADAVELQPGGWKQQVDGLGEMHHAFPQTRMTTDDSWARDPFDVQYLMFMSDGDLGMLGGMGKALGYGRAFLTVLEITRMINACGFHKPRSIETNISKKLAALKGRPAGGASNIRTFLEEHDTYQGLFGNLVDECMQTDCPVIGRAVWALVLLKCAVYRLDNLANHFERYHNPTTGRQGVWGRWNHVQDKPLVTRDEGPGMSLLCGSSPHNEDSLTCQPCATPQSCPVTSGPCATPLGCPMTRTPRPHTIHDVTRGDASSSNGIEALMNKHLSKGTNMSLPYGVLITRAQLILTELSENLSSLQFSLVPDQQGECKLTAHNKKSGRIGCEYTGKFRHHMHDVSMT
jgi:hypothetical protein